MSPRPSHHREGARFGLSKVSSIDLASEQEGTTIWYVPRAGKLREQVKMRAYAILGQEIVDRYLTMDEAEKTYRKNGDEKLFTFVRDYGDQLEPILADLKTKGPSYDDIKFAPNLD